MYSNFTALNQRSPRVFFKFFYSQLIYDNQALPLTIILSEVKNWSLSFQPFLICSTWCKNSKRYIQNVLHCHRLLNIKWKSVQLYTSRYSSSYSLRKWRYIQIQLVNISHEGNEGKHWHSILGAMTVIRLTQRQLHKMYFLSYFLSIPLLFTQYM